MESKILYLIRHAESLYNQVANDIRIAEGELGYHEVRFSPRYCDCSITPRGYDQLKSAVDYVKSLEISRVYVSPLQRALLTCKYLFQDHPCQPTVIVHPLLTERLGNSPDVSNYDGVPFCEYSSYDWSHMPEKEHYWMFDIIRNAQMNRIQLTHSKPSEARQEILDTMRRIYPVSLETFPELTLRANEFKEFLIKDIENFNGKVACVGHNNFFQGFTTRQLPDGTIEKIRLENLQVFPYTLI